MGEAKRRRESGERISHCRTCTLCCTLPDIAALDKPMYRPCANIENRGCGIFGLPARPTACIAYECAYLTAQLTDAAERRRIPHPIECGAYFHRDPVEKVVVLFVDPAKPELWKRSSVVEILRPFLRSGHSLLIIDRGRRMTIASEFYLDELLKLDFVAFAEREGRPLDIPSFVETANA